MINSIQQNSTQQNYGKRNLGNQLSFSGTTMLYPDKDVFEVSLKKLLESCGEPKNVEKMAEILITYFDEIKKQTAKLSNAFVSNLEVISDKDNASETDNKMHSFKITHYLKKGDTLLGEDVYIGFNNKIRSEYDKDKDLCKKSPKEIKSMVERTFQSVKPLAKMAKKKEEMQFQVNLATEKAMDKLSEIFS